MMRKRPTRPLFAPVMLIWLIAIASAGCDASGPPQEDASSQTPIADSQASPSAPDDPRTMTVDAANLGGASTLAAGTPLAESRQATGTADALASATANVIATATAGPALAEANVPGGWNLVLYEPFENNEHRWPAGADDSSPWVHIEREIGGGQYIVKANASQGFSSFAYPQMPSVLDFYVSLDGRLDSGQPASEYGLITHLDPQTGDYYAFLINERGLWAVSLHKDGQWTILQTGRSSQIVSGGNRLAVMCRQNDFTFYVNNQPVAQAHDDRLSAPGKTGIFVEGTADGADSTITFDNFTLLTP